MEAEHEKFPMDARRTPGWILRDHQEDQFTDLLGDSPSTADAFSHFAEHGPVQFESGLVPPSNRFRQDEKERLFPIGPDVARYDPEQFVDCPSLGLGCLRFNTASCRRSARFSNIRLRCARKMRITAPNQSRNRLNMAAKV